MSNKAIYRFTLAATILAILLRASQPGWYFLLIGLGSVVIPIIPFVLIYHIVLTKRWVKSDVPMPDQAQIFSLITSVSLVAMALFALDMDDTGNVWLWRHIDTYAFIPIIQAVLLLFLGIYVTSYVLFYRAYRKSFPKTKTESLPSTQQADQKVTDI